MQFAVHYSLHLVFPILFALSLYRKIWKKAYIIMLGTMLVDLDHLLASPVFEACRCSIGFHPLHSYAAVIIYLAGLLPRRTRVVSIGLVWHMITDSIDCYLSLHYC